MPRRRLNYGRRRGQHGDLWVPEVPLPDTGPGRPVVVLLHGGFWKAIYTMRLMSALAADLEDRGWAVWNLEYRRVGSFSAGGWPATFEDVAAGVQSLSTLAGTYQLDLSRVVVVGHSAGGHLALWAASAKSLALAADPAVRLRGVVGLAPVADLAEAARLGLGGGAASALMGGSPRRHPDRYAAANPIELLPTGVPQILVHGDRDGAVPLAFSRHYVELAVSAGDPALLVELPGAGHMELIDPSSSAWSSTIFHLRRLLT